MADNRHYAYARCARLSIA